MTEYYYDLYSKEVILKKDYSAPIDRYIDIEVSNDNSYSETWLLKNNNELIYNYTEKELNNNYIEGVKNYLNKNNYTLNDIVRIVKVKIPNWELNKLINK